MNNFFFAEFFFGRSACSWGEVCIQLYLCIICRQDVYGPNEILIEVKSYFKLFVEEVGLFGVISIIFQSVYT